MFDPVIPFALQKPISSAPVRPAQVPRLVIFHTNASSGTANWRANLAYINRTLAAGGTPTQPTGQVDLDGTVAQFLPADRKAVASYRGDGISISFETQDHGSKATRPDGSPWSIEDQPWSAEQVETLARIAAWAHVEWGIPLVRATAWDGTGIGTHAMWGINTVLVPQRNPWTKYRGKTCPGRARSSQLDQIIARAVELATPVLPPPPPPPPPSLMIGDDLMWIIQHPDGAQAITNWVHKRGMTPEDLNLVNFLGICTDPASGRVRFAPVSPAVWASIPDVRA